MSRTPGTDYEAHAHKRGTRVIRCRKTVLKLWESAVVGMRAGLMAGVPAALGSLAN
ncbi:MAG: hypothetical protein AAF556_05795 [Pseudomonadota bacterium]